jgi:hypothetical protein
MNARACCVRVALAALAASLCLRLYLQRAIYTTDAAYITSTLATVGISATGVRITTVPLVAAFPALGLATGGKITAERAATVNPERAAPWAACAGTGVEVSLTTEIFAALLHASVARVGCSTWAGAPEPAAGLSADAIDAVAFETNAGLGSESRMRAERVDVFGARSTAFPGTANCTAVAVAFSFSGIATYNVTAARVACTLVPSGASVTAADVLLAQDGGRQVVSARGARVARADGVALFDEDVHTAREPGSLRRWLNAVTKAAAGAAPGAAATSGVPGAAARAAVAEDADAFEL